MTPFIHSISIFRLLFNRNARYTQRHHECIVVIRHINLDVLWSREPSTIKGNMRVLSKCIATCESSGMKPNLPMLGPMPFKDNFGFVMAHSMVLHSLNPGRHNTIYTQYATIQKQRATFSNLYFASSEITTLWLS